MTINLIAKANLKSITINYKIDKMGYYAYYYHPHPNPPTDEECRRVVREIYLNSVKPIRNYFLGNTLSTEDINWLEAAYEMDEEEMKKWKAIFLRRIRMIDKGLCREAVRKRYCNDYPGRDSKIPDVDYGSMKYYNGKFYVEYESGTCAPPVNIIFRPRGCPEKWILESYKEFEEYFTTNYKELYNNTEIEVKKKVFNFWEKYPEGLIMIL